MTAIAAVAIALAFRPGPSAPETRLDIATPPTTDPASLAISPDGKKILFVATSQGHPQLFLRALDSVSARPLPGTAGASVPFWKPDNRSVGFFADGKLKRIDIESGSVQELAEARVSRWRLVEPRRRDSVQPEWAGFDLSNPCGWR